MYRFILISTFTIYLLVLSAQADIHSATAIVLSGDEIDKIEKEYKERVNAESSAPPTDTLSTEVPQVRNNVDDTVTDNVEPSAQSQDTTTTDDNESSAPLTPAPGTPQLTPTVNTVDEELKNWTISATPVYNATMYALAAHKKQAQRIVLLVGETAIGCIGINVAEKLIENKVENLMLVILPRYKTEVLKDEEADTTWETHLKKLKNHSSIVVKDFRTTTAFMATKAVIGAYKKKLNNYISESKRNQTASKDQVQAGKPSQEKVGSNLQNLQTFKPSKPSKNVVVKALEEEANELVRFLQRLNLKSCVVIDSMGAAAYEHMNEVLPNYVIRYKAAEAVNHYLNESQAKNNVITGSFDPPTNTTTEHGYLHVSKDGKKEVTLIPNSHIPNFKVLITFPREEVMALEGTDPSSGVGEPSADTVSGPSAVTPGVEYQYRDTKTFLTVYVDSNHSQVSIADCIEKVTMKRARKNFDKTQDAADAKALSQFITELKAAEAEYRVHGTGGFVLLNLPNPVAESVAYVAEIAQLDEKPVTRSSLEVTEVTKSYPCLKFADYAAMIASGGKRVTHANLAPKSVPPGKVASEVNRLCPGDVASEDDRVLPVDPVSEGTPVQPTEAGSRPRIGEYVNSQLVRLKDPNGKK